MFKPKHAQHSYSLDGKAWALGKGVRREKIYVIPRHRPKDILVCSVDGAGPPPTAGSSIRHKAAKRSGSTSRTMGCAGNDKLLNYAYPLGHRE